MNGYHRSVLVKEVLELLEVGQGKRFIDATLGDGGHSLAIVKTGGKVLGIDADKEAIGRANQRFSKEKIDPSAYFFTKGNFKDIKLIAKGEFDGVVFDLGVSSYQLEQEERGFSFLKEAWLDMRMDQSLPVKAFDLVNALDKNELEQLFFKFGEFKDRRVIEAIVNQRRTQGPIKTTTQLAQLIERVVGRRGKIHPATLVFQALRIAVNDELNNLKLGLTASLEAVKTGGRIVVVSFHSLEDRIVKNVFKDWKVQGKVRVLTDKPLVPRREEVYINPRSRSSKLRAVLKI